MCACIVRKTAAAEYRRLQKLMKMDRVLRRIKQPSPSTIPKRFKSSVIKNYNPRIMVFALSVVAGGLGASVSCNFGGSTKNDGDVDVYVE